MFKYGFSFSFLMRAIPENNLAYPILLRFNTGSSGSGFFLKTNKKVFLITAKHVLFDERKNLRGAVLELTCQTEKLSDKNVIKYSIVLEEVSKYILYHESSDVCAIEMGVMSKLVKGKKHVVDHHQGITISPSSSSVVSVDARTATKFLKDVFISNDVFMYGYPSTLGFRHSPQFDYEAPLLRKGIIANIYASKGTIILDCPSYYGNSGGPVVEVSVNGLVSEHKVVGVISQFIPFVEEWVNNKSGLKNINSSNSGYSVAVSMDEVFKLINYGG